MVLFWKGAIFRSQNMSRENILDPLTFEMPIRFRISIIKNDIHCSQYLLVFTRCSLLQIVKVWDSNFKQIILNKKKKRFMLNYTPFLYATLLQPMPGWYWQKIKQEISNTLRLKFCYFKIMGFVHPRYHQKITGTFWKIQKNKYVRLNEVIWLMTMKMRLKMENRSHRSDKNGPRPWHGHKYTKYKMWWWLHVLSHIWSSIHEKVKQYWGLVEKKVCLYKKCVFLQRTFLFITF